MTNTHIAPEQSRWQMAETLSPWLIVVALLIAMVYHMTGHVGDVEMCRELLKGVH